ncbi:MAG TPA: hypothetical protein VGO46_17960 [Gemmatimonadaceae bacterium]|nr:hypothetical protein [Gemmatimonadaceae bacterium]
MVRRVAYLALLSFVAAACSGGDNVQRPQTVTITPDLTGYNTIRLGEADGRASGGPDGTFSYMVVDGAISWYVFASHLAPSHAYRVVLTAPDGKEYAVASRQSGEDGSLGAHGVETTLMNRQCVGSEDPSRRTLESVGSLTVAVKNDGSARGASGNDLLGSRSALPCGGNGDGNFDYVLQSIDSVSLAR